MWPTKLAIIQSSANARLVGHMGWLIIKLVGANLPPWVNKGEKREKEAITSLRGKPSFFPSTSTIPQSPPTLFSYISSQWTCIEREQEGRERLRAERKDLSTSSSTNSQKEEEWGTSSHRHRARRSRVATHNKKRGADRVSNSLN